MTVNITTIKGDSRLSNGIMSFIDGSIQESRMIYILQARRYNI